MSRTFALLMFAFERVRTVVLALSLIVLLKTLWILLTPVAG
ncbi:MAG: hypothetical protein R3C25_03420 [Hyphomonadaceae bacterium]